MIEIDGSRGEGGGQILRTALALAALTGQTLHLTDIRAKRPKPGLLRQHLTAAKAVAAIAAGCLEGAELNSPELWFTPDRLVGGEYYFAVGSAGSALLVAQAVLPLLLCADRPSRVVIEGGTHAARAPIFEFFDRVFLPCLRKMGAEITATLERIGFYPAGGGRIVLAVSPIRAWKPLELTAAGGFRRAALVALGSGISEKIRLDELRYDREALKVPLVCVERSLEVDSPGSGNVMYAELEYENITELFSVCGDFDISRQVVGRRVAKMVDRYRALGAPVWRFLADQLLLPMAVGAGGEFLTAPPSEHTLTNIEVIGKFLAVDIKIVNRQNGQYSIEVKQ